jgi:GT2 family glycosyltransferase/glycosyltransferase involved in cell wall biosynthesis
VLERKVDVSVIIPVYNALALVQQCLGSVFNAGSSLRFEVIVVDNGSGPDVGDWLVQQEQVRANLRHLRYPRPLGFAGAVNAGVAAASGETLVILNSDTVVSQGWLDALCDALKLDPSLGAVTPMTNQAGEPAQMDPNTTGLALAKAFIRRSGRSPVSAVRYLAQRLTFFCVAVRREVWLALGGLDESYGVGNFEDDDLCLRIRVAGYRLGVAQHVFVYHHNNATFHANQIDHATWLTRNAVIFAEHARQSAEASDPPVRRWPKRTADDISVVILPKAGGSLDRTMLSLANQTVRDFEVILPGGADAPTRSWIAYITQGDILYPFHLEALFDVLNDSGAEAIFSDGWVADTTQPISHPDASHRSGKAPLLLPGWMHHSSLDPNSLLEQSVPSHWPRLTWEMQELPPVPSAPPGKDGSGIVDAARRVYRSLVPFQTRLAIDARVRKIIGREIPDAGQVELQRLELKLRALVADGAHAGQFAVDTAVPTVIMFNAVPWNSAVQRQHHFARGLAERGHQVFWVDTLLHPARNWWTGRPFQEGAPGVHLVRLPGTSREIYHMPWTSGAVDGMSAALELIVSAYGIREAVSLINFPRWQPLVSRLCEQKGWRVIYDCLDDQAALADLYHTHLGSSEEDLVDDADLLFTSSIVLQKRFRRRPSTLLHNAADYELFSCSTSAGHLRHLPRPIVGFFGALADWLDMELIHAAAQRFPGWSFVYIGPHTFSGPTTETKWLRCTDSPNITVLPQKDPRSLATYLADFDVCIMPFLDMPVTRTMNAVKLYEYLAAGKPTVSRDLPEVRHLVKDENGAAGLIALYSTPEQFYDRLLHAVETDSPELYERRQRFARANDWSHRIDVLSGSICQLVYDTSSISASSRGSKTRSQE